MSFSRTVILAGLTLVVGCAGPMAGPPGQVPPVGADRPEPRSSDPSGPVGAEPSVGDRHLPVVDSAARADSLADAFILELLQDATDPDTTAEPIEVTWDIDVSSYTTHHRVQYYLRFFQNQARERMAIWLERLPVYEPMIRTVLQEANLPEDLVYLALIESGFSNSAVSRSRAVGMWQFMPGTARMFGLRIDRWVDERRDPVKATDAAVRYLAALTGQFGSPYVAAAAYNGGPGRVSRGLKRLPMRSALMENGDGASGPSFMDAAFFELADTRYIRPETKDYVPKLIAAALIAKEPERYGFSPQRTAKPYEADSLSVEGAVGIDVVARLAGAPEKVLRELNPHLLRGITSPGRTTVLRLPPGTGAAATAGLAALPPEERVSFLEHVVRRGENLGVIARRYRVSVSDLRDANPRVRPTRLQIGQVLVVPTLGGSPAGRASAPATRESPRSVSTHLVRRGETLGAIARRYRVSVGALQEWNGLRGTTIRAGQRLRVAGPGQGSRAATSGRVHTVRRGETLSGIAERYGVSIRALQSANGLRSSRIRAGARLTIPGSATPSASR